MIWVKEFFQQMTSGTDSVQESMKDLSSRFVTTCFTHSVVTEEGSHVSCSKGLCH